MNEALKIRSHDSRLVAAVLVAAAMAFPLCVAISVIAAPPEVRVRLMSDDAFYYLGLARNFATQGRWSFDSGVSVTTGFHPLHGYALAAMYWCVRPAPEQFVKMAVLLTYLLTLPACALAGVWILRQGSVPGALLLFLFMWSRNFCMNAISGMEWPWVISTAAAYCAVFYAVGASRPLTERWLLFALGFIGSLARTDFGLLPAVIAGVAVVESARARRLKSSIGALCGLAGACLGLLAGFGHNYLVSGEFVQSSARMKSLWIGVYGASFDPIVSKTATLFGSRNAAAVVLAASLVLLVLVAGGRRFLAPPARGRNGDVEPPREDESRKRMLWLAGLFATAGYLLFYRYAAEVLYWYTANLLVPVFLVAALPLTGAVARPVRTAATAILIALCVMQALSDASLLRKSGWHHQVAMYRAGRYLHDTKLGGRVGSWNAGIIGYYEGGTVINLDGLVNNDIYRYARTNDTARYIDEKKIAYVVDFENMLNVPALVKRGGYAGSSLVPRLRPVRVFEDEGPHWYWNRMTIYKVEAPGAPVPPKPAAAPG